MYVLVVVLCTYVVHHIRLCILTTRTLSETEIVAETKINVAAAKNAPGVPRGGPGPPLGSLGGPTGCLVRHYQCETTKTLLEVRT